MDRNNNQDSHDDDPYSQLLSGDDNKLEAPKVESARQRKWRKLTEKGGQLVVMAQQGFIMGSLVGCSFGFIIGCYQAFQSRRLIVIPISTVISGASFGCLMACGSMVRSYEGKELKYKTDEDLYNSLYWKSKYAVPNN